MIRSLVAKTFSRKGANLGLAHAPIWRRCCGGIHCCYLPKRCRSDRSYCYCCYCNQNQNLGTKMNCDKPVFRYKKMTPNAHSPVQGSQKAAGLDLKSAYDITVKARDRAFVKTDLQICVPSGCYGRVAPRSGLALKSGIDVGAGVIDEDYRGNVGVLLFNFSDDDFEVKAGDRIAQLICERIVYPQLEEVTDLDTTVRGTGGFGSTGIRSPIKTQ